MERWSACGGDEWVCEICAASARHAARGVVCNKP